ncbi:hypothetical protein MnTg01_00837 [archaeon MnTg01]|nr:hypothetical protein MnTg01_00837 [archaeon MnTg01]
MVRNECVAYISGTSYGLVIILYTRTMDGLKIKR